MKNLLLAFLVMFAFTVSAQTVVKPSSNMVFTQGGTAADTLTASATKNYSVYFATSDQLVYRIGVVTDSVSGTAAYTGTLQGSMDNINYVDITAISVTTSGDTTFYYTQTTGNDWIYLRVNLVATSSVQKSMIYIYYYFIKKE